MTKNVLCALITQFNLYTMADYYTQALETIRYILQSNTPDTCFEHWISWIDKDLSDWGKMKDTSHHRRAYGGMGSFNDLPPIQGNNGHYSIIFNLLKSFCYRFASLYGRSDQSTKELQEECMIDICTAAYHPHTEINLQVAQYLKNNTLLQNIDLI